MLLSYSPEAVHQTLVCSLMAHPGQALFNTEDKLELKPLPRESSLAKSSAEEVLLNENYPASANARSPTLKSPTHIGHQSNKDLQRIKSSSIEEERADLDASVDALMFQELQEFATGKKEVKRPIPMVPSFEIRSTASTPAAISHRQASLQGQDLGSAELSLDALLGSSEANQDAVTPAKEAAVDLARPLLESGCLTARPQAKSTPIPAAASVDDLLSLSSAPIIASETAVTGSGTELASGNPFWRQSEFAASAVQGSERTTSGRVKFSQEVPDMGQAGSGTLSQSPKTAQEPAKSPQLPAVRTSSIRRQRSSSLPPQPRSSRTTSSPSGGKTPVASPVRNNAKPAGQSPHALPLAPTPPTTTSPFSAAQPLEKPLNPFAAAQPAQSSATQPLEKPLNPFAAAQPAQSSAAQPQEKSQTPVVAVQQPQERAINPFGAASADASPFSQPANSKSLKSTPFEKTAYQEVAFQQPEEDIVKIEAAKLSASISSSTHIPSVSDVSRAILTHNTSSPDMSKANSEASIQAAKSCGLGSRKASRVPSLETVMEVAASSADSQNPHPSPPQQSQEAMVNPVIAQLKSQEGLGSAGFLSAEGVGMPSKRSEGMKSLSILETEGIPQLRHKASIGATITSTSDTDSPLLRANLAHEGCFHFQPANERVAIGARLSTPRVSKRAQTLPSTHFNTILDDLEDTPFKSAKDLDTIVSGKELYQGDFEDMSSIQAIQHGIGNFKPADSLVGSPPSACSLMAEAAEKQEQEAEWIIDFDDLEMGRCIGNGSYGEVYRAHWRHTDVAVKKMTRITESHLEDFKQEVSLMAKLKHPNIVQFLGACVNLPNLSIVTQFMPRGSLFNLLHKSQVRLDDKQKLWMALDCAKGMHYLHSCKPPIVHGDVSSKNMLVDRDFSIRVADFGMSRQKRKEKLSASKAAGTAEWTAPEVLRGLPYSEKADVFSFGVILHELMTQQVPWEELTPFQVSTTVGWNNERLDISEEIDPRLADLIRQCFESEPENRPDFGTIIIALRGIRSSLLNKPAEAGSKGNQNEKRSNPAATSTNVSKGLGQRTSTKTQASAKGRTLEENQRRFNETQQKKQDRAAKASASGRLSRSQSLDPKKAL